MTGDEAGAYLVSPDAQFTLNVIPIDMEHVADGMTKVPPSSAPSTTGCSGTKGGEPEVLIDEAKGKTLITSEWVGTGGCIEHKLGVYQYAKQGADKFYIVTVWAPMEEVEANSKAAQAILGSIELK